MMKNIITFIALTAGGFVFAQPTSGDPIMPETKNDTTLVADVPLEQPKLTLEASITFGFSKGDASKLVDYFGENIDISILGKANLYSKPQAEQVLQRFFAENPPVKFTIIHKGGGKKSAKYFIGELVDKAGKTYRVTVNSKVEGQGDIIVLLSVEKS